MKTIKITDEMYNSLINISKEINGQNHRGTAMPYFFQIQTDEIVSVGDGQGTEVWGYDGSILETDAEIKAEIISIKEWEENEADELFDKLDDYEIEEILEGNEWTKWNMDIVKKYQNAFFTENGCKQHILSNNYHYNNPTDFLSYAFRNPEMELIMQFLCELTGGKIHK